MQKTNQNISILLRSLAKGIITSDELRLLNEWASDDPFLQDAISGISNHKGNTNDLVWIRSQIEQLTKKRDRRFPLYRIAAVILLLVVSGAALFVIQQNFSEKQMAIATEQEEAEKKTPASDTLIPGEIAEIKTESPTNYMPETSTRSESDFTEEVPDDDIPASSDLATRKQISDEVGALKIEQYKAQPVAVEEEKVLAEPASDEVALSGTANKIVKRVTENEVEPKTVFDEDFSIPALKDENVAVDYSGFKSKEAMAEAFPETEMEQARAPEEEEISERRRGSNVETNENKTFEKYLLKNKVYPQAASQNGVHGDVILKFILDSKGNPGDIRVIQSLGFGCDKEAIRLLKEGPQWKGIEGEEIQYTITF